MSNVGVGFFALFLVGVVSLFALGLGLLAGLVAAFHRRNASVPRILPSLAGVLLIGVIVVTAFGLIAVAVGSPRFAVFVVLTIPVPVLVVSYWLRRTRGASTVDSLVAAAMAWGMPFLGGIAVFFGTTLGIEAVFDLPPATPRGRGVNVIAAVGAAAVVVAGGLAIGRRIHPLLPPRTGERDGNTLGVAGGTVAGLIIGIVFGVVLGLDGVFLIGFLGLSTGAGGVIGGSLR